MCEVAAGRAGCVGAQLLLVAEWRCHLLPFVATHVPRIARIQKEQLEGLYGCLGSCLQGTSCCHQHWLLQVAAAPAKAAGGPDLVLASFDASKELHNVVCVLCGVALQLIAQSVGLSRSDHAAAAAGRYGRATRCDWLSKHKLRLCCKAFSSKQRRTASATPQDRCCITPVSQPSTYHWKNIV